MNNPSTFRDKCCSLLSLFGKLDAQNQVLETKAVHLGGSLFGIRTIHVADESKALGHASFPVLGKEHSGDATEALEHVAQLALLGHLGNLKWVLAVAKLEKESSSF